jgi:hypothetical protein
VSHTLLDAVNETLKRVRVIDTANTGLLASLTSSSVQHNIDVAVQVINEGIDELYTAIGKSMPGQSAESTIVTSTGAREYTLAANLVTIKWPMIDRVNTQYLWQWEDTYEDLLGLDPQQNQTGLPIWGMISPITSKLRVDRACDTASNGHTYFYEYEVNTALVNAADAIPFNDACFRSMVPAWVQLYKREERNEFDQPLFQQAIGRASRFLSEEKPRDNYSSRSGNYS